MAESSTVKGAASPSFNELPTELRLAIWTFALPDEDAPELLFYGGPEDQQGPIMVNTGYPVLMHVCAESRAVALRETYLEYSRNAGMKIPRRRYRPDLDVQYINLRHDGQTLPAPGCKHVTGSGILQMHYQWLCSLETYTFAVPPEAVSGGTKETGLDRTTGRARPYMLPPPERGRRGGPRYRARVRLVGPKESLVDEAQKVIWDKIERHMHNVYKARCEIDPALDPENPRPQVRAGVFEMWMQDQEGVYGWHAPEY
ncbi:uncharacterized protein PG998_007227 [Apiospora kogelbergensis]|uniref:uncharacterized protein n=1 Tax=Apiospora kogelbergensis TaxID=1337665 RepID=UPI00312F4D3C